MPRHVLITNARPDYNNLFPLLLTPPNIKTGFRGFGFNIRGVLGAPG